MFGYVAANPQMLTEEETQRYRSAYCGLCKCLGRRHGQLTRLSLTYDMAFLALFLGAMYEPEEWEEEFRCAVHPKGKHTALTTKFTEYAADMNVLLAYLNCMDNWQDDKNLLARTQSYLFRKGNEEGRSPHPRQAEAIGRELRALAELEAANCSNLDEPANCFGRLLGELFVYDEKDFFARDLRQFGFFLGKFIYLYDACMDYTMDQKTGSYNPVVLQYPKELNEETARQILTVYISACTQQYERLPIVQDNVIIRNILYSGVWQKFRQKYKTAGNGSTEE